MAGNKKSSTPKKYTLDIIDVLRHADQNDLNYYDTLSEAERASIKPFVLMRWMSSVSNNNPNAAYHIIAVNNIVNDGFFDLGKFPDLQWKLIASCGAGTPQRHQWIKGPGTIVTNRLDNLILQLNPSLNDLEMDLVKRKFTRDGLIRLCKDLAMEDSEIKPIVDEFQKYKKDREQDHV